MFTGSLDGLEDIVEFVFTEYWGKLILQKEQDFGNSGTNVHIQSNIQRITFEALDQCGVLYLFRVSVHNLGEPLLKSRPPRVRGSYRRASENQRRLDLQRSIVVVTRSSMWGVSGC